MKSLGVPESQLIILRDVDALQGGVEGAAGGLLTDAGGRPGHRAQTLLVTTNAGGKSQGPGASTRGPADPRAPPVRWKEAAFSAAPEDLGVRPRTNPGRGKLKGPLHPELDVEFALAPAGSCLHVLGGLGLRMCTRCGHTGLSSHTPRTNLWGSSGPLVSLLLPPESWKICHEVRKHKGVNSHFSASAFQLNPRPNPCRRVVPCVTVL